MNKLYRAFIALSTILPISLPFSFVFSDTWVIYLPSFMVTGTSNDQILFIVYVAFANLLVGKLIALFLTKTALKYLRRNNVRINSVKLLGGDSMMSYLPYVLPLFITQSNMQPLIGCLIGAILLLLLAFCSSTIPFSPLLKMCGIQFYEVELADHRVVTLLIGNKNIQPLKVSKAAVISDFCLYGVE